MADGVETERDAFAERIHEAALGFFDVLSIRFGDRLGLYAALAEGGAATPSELAERARDRRAVRPRVARTTDRRRDPSRRRHGHGTIRFSLPAGHAEVLLDRDSLSYMMPTVRSLMTLTPVMDALVDAFRTGGGVSWDAYGTDAREAVGDSNRPIYLQVLPREWLPKIPEIHDRLRTAPPARVADIGCGTGWSSIAIAAAYPGVRVDGFDRDEESLAFARRTPRRAAWPTACRSRRGMPVSREMPARTTWSRSSSACTTCRGRSRR